MHEPFVDIDWITFVGKQEADLVKVEECINAKLAALRKLEVVVEKMPDILDQVQFCQGVLNNLRQYIGKPIFYYFYCEASRELDVLDQMLAEGSDD